MWLAVKSTFLAKQASHRYNMSATPEIISAILDSLASGGKTRAQIADEFDLHPSVAGGALAKLISAGQVIVSGKVISGKNEISLNSLRSRQPGSRSDAAHQGNLSDQTGPQGAATSLQTNSDLYQRWGGYLPIDQNATKKLTVRRHTEH